MIAAVLLFLLGWFGVSLTAGGLYSLIAILARRRAQQRAIEELIRWANCPHALPSEPWRN